MAFPTSPTDGQIYKSYVFQANIWKKVDPEKLFPVGFIYTQYPGKSDPTTLGWYGTWVNKSSEYAGDFFRTEGGNALAFNGGRQNSDNLSHTHTWPQTDGQAGGGGYIVGKYGNGIGAYPASQASGGSEARPQNRTIRLWERVS